MLSLSSLQWFISVASPMLLRGFSKTKLFYVAAPIHQSQPCGWRSYEVQFAAIHQESCNSEISKCGTSFCMVGAVLGTPSLSGFCKKWDAQCMCRIILRGGRGTWRTSKSNTKTCPPKSSRTRGSRKNSKSVLQEYRPKVRYPTESLARVSHRSVRVCAFQGCFMTLF